MTVSDSPTRGYSRKITNLALAVIAPLAIVLVWYVAPDLFGIANYKLPPIPQIIERFWDLSASGALGRNLIVSAWRFVAGMLTGLAIALPLGLAIALSRHTSDFLRPVLIFFQAIAGIAWVPMAIIWFGFGEGPVIFVVANTVFFSTIYNIVSGIEAIPRVLRNAVQSLGATPFGIFWELLLPGALVQILVGLRTSMAFGLRALVGAEMIAGTSGLGFMTIDASQSYGTDTVIVGMLVIAVVWFLLDRIVFIPLERRTIIRWGLQKAG